MTRSPRTSTSVDQALVVLREVGRAGRPLGVVEVARHLDLHASTAHRFLRTLVEAGFLAREPHGRGYGLGIAAHELAHALFERFAIRDLAAPVLEELACSIGETCTLGVPIGRYVVRVAGARGCRNTHAAMRLSEARCLDLDASGWAILATMPVADADEHLVGRAATHVDLPARRHELACTGLILQESADVAETTIVATPIRDVDGLAAGVIIIEGPPNQFCPRPRQGDLDRALQLAAGLEQAIAGLGPEALRPFGHLPADVLLLGDDASSTDSPKGRSVVVRSS